MNLTKDTKIFLLDLNAASGLGSTIQRILESSFNLNIQIREESVTLCVSSLCDSELISVISRFNPIVIFIVLNSKHIKQFNALIQSISSQKSELPIILVIEDSKPNEMIELLKLGVADFITPPLKSIDILPRLWRLLEKKIR